MNSYIATKEFAPGTSRGRRSRRTLALQMAMEAEKQRAVGHRLRELRGARTQQPIADFVGVTLRAYQAWEAGDSGLKWANIEKLAEYHGVSEDYILYGTEDNPPTMPDDRLERIEEKLDLILGRLPTPEDRTAEEAAAELEALPGRLSESAVAPKRPGPARSAKKRGAGPRKSA